MNVSARLSRDCFQMTSIFFPFNFSCIHAFLITRCFARDVTDAGSCIIPMVDWLSSNINVGSLIGSPRSSSRMLSHSSSWVSNVSALSSASALDRLTVASFFDFDAITDPL